MDRVQALRTLASPDSTLTPLTTPQIQTLITTHLSRHTPELSELRAARRAGRPPSNREMLLSQAIEKEEREYVSGYWVPDFSNESNLLKLQMWDGKWGSLATVKFVRITREGVRLESSFPPKGMS